ncbi:sensor of ECF-type sigma factor [Hanstruepera marina]|uniref:sensor of ECF-type sigma factor n=1 Tax=Hanstruepera marina TaxID=2873265 RepID=UPI001CA63371|nr:sensor of ECF-type sigma factor [Hanstruepera marina]
MKNTLILFICLLFYTISFSQDRMDRNEKIKALKTAYITEKLNLSKTEAEKFWPIYNAFEERMNKMREEMYRDRKSIDIDNMTEAQANTLLQKFKNSNTERNDLYNNYISDLQNVISSKKIVLLKKVEDDFKRKMFEEFKKRRHQKGDDKP